jgi:hypothetical protein
MRTGQLFLLVGILALALVACGPNPEQLAATSAAETQAAASPTPPPSETPLPSPTATETPLPSATPEPSATPTRTLLPSRTPTITATPGPFTFYDDFSTDSGGWEDCEGCTWKDGRLVMGPYDPSSYFHDNYCTGCGENKYYRMAVDATFIDGQVDRFYGVIFADGSSESYFLGISPWGFYTLDRWLWNESYWENVSRARTNVVVGSYGTNHFEIVVKPATQEGFSDYFIYINGTLVTAVYTRKTEGTWVGFAMDYHAQVAAYDNWEYEELEP